MDPLTIKIVCDVLVGLISALTPLTIELVNGMRESRKEMIAVQSELSGLSLCLQSLQADASDPQFYCPPQILQNLMHVLRNCEAVLKDVEAFLQKFLSHSLARKAQWALTGEQEIATLRVRLEAHKSTLNIALDLVTMSTTSAIKQDTSKLLEEIAELRDQVSKLESVRVGGDGDRNIILQRFLDESTVYAGSVIGDFTTEAETLQGDLVNEPSQPQISDDKHLSFSPDDDLKHHLESQLKIDEKRHSYQPEDDLMSKPSKSKLYVDDEYFLPKRSPSPRPFASVEVRRVEMDYMDSVNEKLKQEPDAKFTSPPISPEKERKLSYRKPILGVSKVLTPPADDGYRSNTPLQSPPVLDAEPQLTEHRSSGLRRWSKQPSARESQANERQFSASSMPESLQSGVSSPGSGRDTYFPSLDQVRSLESITSGGTSSQLSITPILESRSANKAPRSLGTMFYTDSKLNTSKVKADLKKLLQAPSSASTFGTAYDWGVPIPSSSLPAQNGYVTAVEVAVHYGFTELAKKLIEKGATFNSKDIQMTPLYFGSPIIAFLHGAVSIHTKEGRAMLDFLLSKGASLDAVDPLSQNVVFIAMTLAAKACTSKMDDTWLPPIESLLRAGADSNLRGMNRPANKQSLCALSPFPCAIASMCKEARSSFVRKLKRYGVSIHEICPEHGSMLMQVIQPIWKNCDVDLMEVLLQDGVDPSAIFYDEKDLKSNAIDRAEGFLKKWPKRLGMYEGVERRTYDKIVRLLHEYQAKRGELAPPYEAIIGPSY